MDFDDTTTGDQRAPGTAGRDQAARPRLLIADDDRLVASALRRALSFDYQVEVATSGPEALALLAAGARFHGALIDVQMPGMGGFDLHQELHARDPHLAARTLFITGGLTSRDQEVQLRRSGRPLLEKPFGSRELQAVLRALLPAVVLN
jgi:CheY-like chemotaxis protein